MKILLETKLLALFFLFFLFNSIQSQFLSDSDGSSDSSSGSSQEETDYCQIPDFIAAIEAIPESGKQFESESALYLQILGEKVLGMNLMIDVLDAKKNPKYVLLSDGNFFQLKTTEFDIVTTDHVFECKASSHPNKTQKTKKMNQFLKERDMLEFFQKVYEDLLEGYLLFKVTINKRGNCILKICGRSTLFQDVSLVSNWVKGSDLEGCAKQWENIIQLLSNKKLILMFKQEISPQFKTRLKKESLESKDQVSYKSYLPYTDKVEHAIQELRLLKLS